MSAQNEHAELQITGMRCASCSGRLEKNLNEMDLEFVENPLKMVFHV